MTTPTPAQPAIQQQQNNNYATSSDTKQIDPGLAAETYRLSVRARELLVESKQKNYGSCLGWFCKVVGLMLWTIMFPLLFAIVVVIALLTLPVTVCSDNKLGTILGSKVMEAANRFYYGSTQPHLRAIIRDMKCLASQANEAATHSKRSQIAYVIRKQTLIENMDRFVKFEEALKRGLIVPIDIHRDLEVFGNGNFNCLFVSHKWIGHSPDSPTNDIFNRIRERLAGNNHAYKYVWFDFTCVPQSDREAQKAMLLAIPYIMQRCAVAPFYADQQSVNQYKSSVWCQLEYIANAIGSGYGVFKVKRQWTIYDKSDLYFVLPGFISMAFSNQYLPRFAGFKQTAAVFGSILDLFIEYHESRFTPEELAAQLAGDESKLAVTLAAGDNV